MCGGGVVVGGGRVNPFGNTFPFFLELLSLMWRTGWSRRIDVPIRPLLMPELHGRTVLDRK